jgi:hypothetical protein
MVSVAGFEPAATRFQGEDSGLTELYTVNWKCEEDSNFYVSGLQSVA